MRSFLPVLAAFGLVLSAAPAAGAEELELLPLPGQATNPAGLERPANGEPRQALPAALLFASFDADGNYQIDRAEFDAGLTQAFSRADADGSGDISPLEFADWAEAALGGREAHPSRTTFDVDLDGRVIGEEFKARLTTLAGQYGLVERGVVRFADLTATAPLAPVDGRRGRRGPPPGEAPR